MSVLKFNVKKGMVGTREVTIIEMTIEGGIIEPQDLRLIEYPDVKGDILVLSGRCPIWVYVNVAHFYMHLFKVICVYDPKVNGAIVCVTHDRSFRVGEIIQL